MRSRVVGAGEEIVSDHRTSSGIFLDTDGDLEIIKIEKKISEWLSIPPIHYESFYLLRYQTGEQYKPHYDYFDKSASQHIGGLLFYFYFLFIFYLFLFIILFLFVYYFYFN